MFKRAVPLFLVAIVVISAGCVDMGFLKTSIPGLSVTENTEKKTADVIVIEDFKTLPKSPVFAGQSFRLYFTVKNNDMENPVNDLRVEIYDPSSFSVTSGPSECAGSCTLSPGGEKIIFFDLIAPSSEEIAEATTVSRIGIRVIYDFESMTKYQVAVINKEEVEKQQQAGKTLSINPNTIMEAGPLKIYPNIMSENFLISGLDGAVQFTLKNEGSGMVRNNKIRTGNLIIEFPTNFLPTGSFLEGNFFDKLSQATGNAIVTGMLLTCSDNCGDMVGCNSGLECADGCGCDCNSECSSGKCQSYGESGSFCVSSFTTTTICHTAGCICSFNSDCTDGSSCQDIVDGHGICKAPEDNIKCLCFGYYKQGTRSCPSGCACQANSDCINGLQCKDIAELYGVCGVPEDLSKCPCYGYYNQAKHNCNDGCTCFSDSDCINYKCSDVGAEGGTCTSSHTTTTNVVTTSTVSTTVIQRTTTSSTVYVPIWQRVEATRFFSCSGNSCTNIEDIELFDEKSSPLMFRISGATVDDVYRVFEIKATAEYEYELRQNFDVTVSPIGLS